MLSPATMTRGQHRAPGGPGAGRTGDHPLTTAPQCHKTCHLMCIAVPQLLLSTRSTGDQPARALGAVPGHGPQESQAFEENLPYKHEHKARPRDSSRRSVSQSGEHGVGAAPSGRVPDAGRFSPLQPDEGVALGGGTEHRRKLQPPGALRMHDAVTCETCFATRRTPCWAAQ